MKIGFDGKRATQNFTGLGNYSRYIIELLAKNFPNNQYLVYSPKKPGNTRAEELLQFPAVTFKHPLAGYFKSLWRSWGIVRDLQNDQINLYHGLSNEIPFGIKKSGIPSVVTVHDLIFLRYPQYYPWFDRQIYKFKFRYACQNADKIIAISEQTKRDIIRYFNIADDRIEVIYQNCQPAFQHSCTDQEKEQIRNSYSLPAKYLLSVGTIESRKNLLLITKALKNITPEVQLVVIGRETPYTEKVKRYIADKHLEHRVRFLKNVPAEHLPGIYQQAEIFIYPSEFEGFGIPVLEALHSGVPVIAATGSCLEEAGGPGSLYVHPGDEAGLTRAIQQVLDNPAKKQEMILAGTKHLRQFSDAHIAKKIIDLYQKIIGHA